MDRKKKTSLEWLYETNVELKDIQRCASDLEKYKKYIEKTTLEYLKHKYYRKLYKGTLQLYS